MARGKWVDSGLDNLYSTLTPTDTEPATSEAAIEST